MRYIIAPIICLLCLTTRLSWNWDIRIAFPYGHYAPLLTQELVLEIRWSSGKRFAWIETGIEREWK